MGTQKRTRTLGDTHAARDRVLREGKEQFVAPGVGAEPAHFIGARVSAVNEPARVVATVLRERQRERQSERQRETIRNYLLEWSERDY